MKKRRRRMPKVTPIAVEVVRITPKAAGSIGRAFTLAGVIRHVGVDPSTQAHTYQGPRWRIVVRGPYMTLLALGAEDRCGLMLVDPDGRIIAPCEVTSS